MAFRLVLICLMFAPLAPAYGEPTPVPAVGEMPAETAPSPAPSESPAVSPEAAAPVPSPKPSPLPLLLSPIETE